MGMHMTPQNAIARDLLEHVVEQFLSIFAEEPAIKPLQHVLFFLRKPKSTAINGLWSQVHIQERL